MRKPVFILFFSIFLMGNVGAQDRANLLKQIDKIIHYDTEIKLSETPGMVIGVRYQDSVYFFSYGTISKDSEKSPDENTIFEIGGVTKSFTAALISQLVAEGKMDYEKSLNDYLPKEERNTETQSINIDQLVTHTSKLPRMPMEFGVKEREPNNPYAYYTQQDLMNFYKEYFPVELKKRKRRHRKRDTKEIYSYSHLNYALLERAIEYSQKQNFETLLQSKILNQLGMNDTRVELSEEQKSRLTTGYTTSGSATPPWTFQSFKASEGLKSTAKDLLTFAAVLTGGNHPAMTKSFEATFSGKRKTGYNKRVQVSRGWHIVKTNKKFYDIIAQTGNTNGHRAYLAFVRETDTAVVILTNSEHKLDNLGTHILKMINNNWAKW